ncbi:DUF1353 domain-containing protein [Shimia sp. W99]
MVRWAFVLGILAVGGCAHVDYDNVKRGEFSGSVYLLWVGSADTALLGDGRFLYVPRAGDALTFKRSLDANPSEGSAVIVPEAFFTDGGSIPRAVQAMPGFNAWGFGPAYVIHDWVFVARKCMNDEAHFDEDLATPEMEKLAKMTFRESAQVMAETIKTLVSDHEVSGGDTVSGPVISSFTAGPLSHQLWSEVGACRDGELTPEHDHLLRSVNEDKGLRAGAALARATKAQPMKIAEGQVAYVVADYSFD